MTNYLATLENAMATLLVDDQPREAAHLKLYLDLIHLEEYYIQHVRVLACMRLWLDFIRRAARLPWRHALESVDAQARGLRPIIE
jgi:hypothetical protein